MSREGEKSTAITSIRYIMTIFSPTMDHSVGGRIPLAGDEHEITRYSRDSYETSVRRFRLTQETIDRYLALIGKYGIEEQAAEEFGKLFFNATSDENLISETLEYPTLNQCRAMKEEHGPVVAVETSFSSSGMMYGSNRSVVQLVEKVEGVDGTVRVTVRMKAGNEPEASDSRELRSGILTKVQEISDRENLPCWHYASIDPSIPVDRSMIPLDYSSYGCVNIYYDDSLITGCPRVKRTIGESACKMGGDEVSSLLSKMVGDCVAGSGVDVKMPEVKFQDFSPLGMGADPSLTNAFEGIMPARKAAVAAQTVQRDADGTWTCSECGQTGNAGKFCPNCGYPAK